MIFYLENQKSQTFVKLQFLHTHGSVIVSRKPYPDCCIITSTNQQCTCKEVQRPDAFSVPLQCHHMLSCFDVPDLDCLVHASYSTLQKQGHRIAHRATRLLKSTATRLALWGERFSPQSNHVA
mgnify:CR=1 FL=1